MADPMIQTVLIVCLSFVLRAALNRGSTCAVLATEELVLRRRPSRFIALFEAALWGVLCLAAMRVEMLFRPGWLSWSLVISGSVLFALGAVLNGACAFGIAGRVGSVQSEYLLSDIGIYLGLVTADLPVRDHALTVVDQSAAFPWPVAAALLFGLTLLRYGLCGNGRGRF